MTGKDKLYSSILGERNDPLQNLVRSTYKQRDKIEEKWEKQRIKTNKRSRQGKKAKPIKPKKGRRIKRKRKKKLNVKKEKNDETYKKIKEGRSEGDQWIYYAIHTIIGSTLFLFIIINYNLFDLREITLFSIFTMDFLYSVLSIFAISLITNIFGRIVGSPILSKIYRKTFTKTFIELNSRGINKIGMRWIVASLISSLLFALGAVAILQYKLFKDYEVYSLILTILIIKIAIYMYTKVTIQTKG